MKASAKRSHSTSNASQTHSNLRQLPVELQYILSDTTKIIPHWKTTLQKKQLRGPGARLSEMQFQKFHEQYQKIPVLH